MVRRIECIEEEVRTTLWGMLLSSWKNQASASVVNELYFHLILKLETVKSRSLTRFTSEFQKFRSVPTLTKENLQPQKVTCCTEKKGNLEASLSFQHIHSFNEMNLCKSKSIMAESNSLPFTIETCGTARSLSPYKEQPMMSSFLVFQAILGQFNWQNWKLQQVMSR